MGGEPGEAGSDQTAQGPQMPLKKFFFDLV